MPSQNHCSRLVGRAIQPAAAFRGGSAVVVFISIVDQSLCNFRRCSHNNPLRGGASFSLQRRLQPTCVYFRCATKSPASPRPLNSPLSPTHLAANHSLPTPLEPLRN